MVIHPRPTASARISGMMTNPPPNDSAPTLNATHATPARTPPFKAGKNGAMAATPAGGRHGTRRHASSKNAHPSSTNTSHGPIVADATPPAAR